MGVMLELHDAFFRILYRASGKLKERGFAEAQAAGTYRPDNFCRLLAKAAHGFAVHILGIDGFRPLLPDVILGKDLHVSHFVGMVQWIGPKHYELGQWTFLPTPSGDEIHQVALTLAPKLGRGCHLAHLRLFAHLRPLPPVYCVVVGEIIGALPITNSG